MLWRLTLGSSSWGSRKCQTVAASPAEPGGLLSWSSERRLSDYSNAGSDWLWEFDENYTFTYFSEPYAAFVGTSVWEAYNDDEMHEALAKRQPFKGFLSVHEQDGMPRWISSGGVPVFDSNGEFRGYRGVSTNITQTKLATTALQKSELQFRHLVEGSLQGISISDGEKRLFVNQAFTNMLGYSSPQEVLEQLPYLRPFMGTEKKDVRTRVQDRLNHGGQGQPFETEMVRKDGTTINVLIMVKAIEWQGRAAVLATLIDISERKHREQALAESHKLLQSLIDGMPEFVALKNANDEYLFVNQVFEQWYDVPREQAIGSTLNDYHPSQMAKSMTALENDAIEKRAPQSVECEATWPDGNVRRTIDTRFPVFDENGNIVARGTIVRDVTELRRTELNLRQAQKMEAIGQLTGGIAHDFNNMLAVILGNLELATLTLEKNHPAIRYLQPAITASDRGATLTQRLLSFARKQPLRVTTVDLRNLVTNLKDMLRQTMGKTIDVEVLNPTGWLWSCEVDPAQLEQALLNLALNARDAMPHGGKLTIQTANVCLDQTFAEENSIEPGHYVVLTVSDTGCGLPPDTEEQIFEPFFTTKDVGQGTGLGLSMVWGFVKQSRGHVAVHSVPDEGTTFRLYLPRSSADAEIEATRQSEQAPEYTPIVSSPA